MGGGFYQPWASNGPFLKPVKSEASRNMVSFLCHWIAGTIHVLEMA